MNIRNSSNCCKDSLKSIMNSFPHFTYSQVEMVYNFFECDLDRTIHHLMHESHRFQEKNIDYPLNYTVKYTPYEIDKTNLKESPKFIKYKRFRFLTVAPIEPLEYNHVKSCLFFTNTTKESPQIFGKTFDPIDYSTSPTQMLFVSPLSSEELKTVQTSIEDSCEQKEDNDQINDISICEEEEEEELYEIQKESRFFQNNEKSDSQDKLHDSSEELPSRETSSSLEIVILDDSVEAKTDSQDHFEEKGNGLSHENDKEKHEVEPPEGKMEETKSCIENTETIVLNETNLQEQIINQFDDNLNDNSNDYLEEDKPIFKEDFDNITCGDIDSVLIEEYTNKQNNSVVLLARTPMSLSPSLEEEVEIECSVNGFNVEVTISIPKTFDHHTGWVGLYDRYETNNKNFIKKVVIEGKLKEQTRFEGLKRGRYSVRLFLNQNNDTTYQHCNTSDFVIGQIVFMTSIIKCHSSKRFIEVRVNEEHIGGWVGIYEHYPIVSNSNYTISSGMTTTYPIILDITNLKPGVYECRYFSKDSSEGLINTKYHCSGSKLFSLY
ncbi:Uncharacterized protein QTN25_007616 [Entamoeba marina]